MRDAQRRQEILAEFEEAQGLGSDRARAASRGVQPRGAFPSSPQHHLIPREFVRNHPRIARLLRRRRIDIDEFTVRTRGTGEHSAVHSVKYNSRWERFFAQHPNATRPQILGFMHRLRRIYRIHDLPIERYVGPTTRTRRP